MPGSADRSASGDPTRRDWDRLGQGWSQAVRTGAVRSTLHVGIAGRVVALSIVGDRLAAEVSEALGHLRVPRATPDLTIEAWHVAETGVDVGPIAAEIDPDLPLAFAMSADRALFAHRQHETAVVFDRGARLARAAVGEIADGSLYERGRPFETMLTVWLRDLGVALVHGAVVSSGERGALIVGKSGSGKSTLAAECLVGGMSLVNDDKVAVVVGPQSARAHGLNASLHLTANSLDRLPGLAPVAVPPRIRADDKYRVPVGRTHPLQMSPAADLVAIVIPSLHDGDETTVDAVRAPAAMRAMAVSTVMAIPSSSEGLDALVALAESVPAWSVRIGRDDRGPEVVAGLLRRD
ncbi:MAG: hypothetical protein RIE08_14630 [Acidimicrobiales bacterium]